MDRRVNVSSHGVHAPVVQDLLDLPGLSSAEKAELGALAREGDAGIFWSDLQRLGFRLQGRDKLDAARVIYGRVQEEAKEESIRDKARQALEAVEGRGAIGGRAEFLLSRFAKDASDPCMILPMLAGTAVYQLAKGAALGRMAAAANPAWWMRGASGRFAASASAYATEVPTFALSGRLMRSFGDPSQPLPNLGQDLGSAAITLGLLKLGGATSQSLLTKTLGQRATPLTRVATAQATMFGSLLAAHRLETGIGLRPQVDGATEMTDILASMVSLGVGASLGQRVLGRSYQGFMQELGLRLQPEARSKWGSFGPELAFANSSFRSGLGKEDLFQPITTYPKGEGGASPAQSPDSFETRVQALEEILAPAPIQKKALIQSERKLWAFEQALVQLKASGKKASPHQIANLAYDIYVEGLPADQKPSHAVFLKLVYDRGENKEPEILALLEKSGVVQAMVKIDPTRKRWAFEQALAQLKASGKKVTLAEAAHLAHGIYIEDLPADQRPSSGTFRNWVSGDEKNKDPEIMTLLDSSGVVEARLKIDPTRKRWAFEQALAQIEASGEKATPLQVADCAHGIYVADLPENQRPNPGTFRNWISGNEKNKDPEILDLLEKSGMVEARLKVDPTRKRWAFEQALAQIEASGEKATPLQVADCAHGIYVADLPENQRPSPGTFRNSVSGKNKDPGIMTLLESSGVVEARVKVDLTRMRWAFKQAIAQFKASEEKATPLEIARCAHYFYVANLPEDQRPSRWTFQKWVYANEKKKDPDIWNLLENSDVLAPVKIDPTRKRWAFEQAIAQLKASGEKATPQRVADRAHAIYIEDLPADQRASRRTFRNWVSGKNKDLEVWAWLESSGMVVAQLRVSIDQARQRQAFEQAISQIKASGKKVTLEEVAYRAHAIYVADLPSGQRPSLHTFGNCASGKTKDAEIMTLLKNSGVVEARLKIDLKRKRWAFEQAIAQLEASNEKATPQWVADRAHSIYVEGLLEDQSPRRGTFRSWVSGENKDPEILAMLESSSMVATRRISIDSERKRLAFEQAISQIKASGEKVTLEEAAYRAHAIYVADLPEDQRPRRWTFRSWVSGENKDPEVLALLEKSGVIKTQVKIDQARKRQAFERAIIQLKAGGEKVSLRWVADVAYYVYVSGLPSDQRPSLGTFRSWVSGKNKDPEILALLKESGVIKGIP